MNSISYLELSGQDISQYIDELAALRISVFLEFPYLYDGSIEYEKNYLKVYSENQQSFVCLAMDNGKVIGASTGTALVNEPAYVTEPFLKNAYQLEPIFYFGESVLKKEYRGQGIGWHFMEARENYARSIGKEMAVFCAVERPLKHPRRPENFFALDAFWKKAGFKPMGIHGYFSWQDLDESSESPKKMNFWSKRLIEK